jgi:hypothetical protein
MERRGLEGLTVEQIYAAISTRRLRLSDECLSLKHCPHDAELGWLTYMEQVVQRCGFAIADSVWVIGDAVTLARDLIEGVVVELRRMGADLPEPVKQQT